MKKTTLTLALILAAAFSTAALASYTHPKDQQADTQVAAKKKGKSSAKKGKA